jgi:hypothetical protein
MRHLSKSIRHFAKCQRGATAMEFAFVMPILLLFTVGILEFSMMFLAQNTLENATNYASREGKTGHVDSGMTREEYMLFLIQSRISRLMDIEKLTLDTKVYRSLEDVGKPEPYTDANNNNQYDLGETYTDTNLNGHWDPDIGVEGLGNSGEVVVYTVIYPWQTLTPFLGNILGNDGIIGLTSRILVKNEPYGNG